jgi:hypothetical protein
MLFEKMFCQSVLPSEICCSKKSSIASTAPDFLKAGAQANLQSSKKQNPQDNNASHNLPPQTRFYNQGQSFVS